MSSLPTKTLLAVGLNQGTGKDSDLTPEVLIAQVKEEQQKLKDRNINTEVYSIDLSLGKSRAVDDMRAFLRSKEWDGVSIGMGIRGAAEHTALFGELTNMVVRESRGPDGKPPMLLFSLRPNRLGEEVERTWPEYFA